MINNEELRWAIARQVSNWFGFECEAGECLPQADAILASAWLAADRKAQRAEAVRDAAERIDLQQAYQYPGSEVNDAESAAEVWLRWFADRIEADDVE